MKYVLLAGVATLCLLSNPAHALNRDSGYGSEKEEAYGKCMADPQCVAALRRTEAKRQASQDAWEQKSIDQKLEPYFWMVAGFAALWYFLGRKR